MTLTEHKKEELNQIVEQFHALLWNLDDRGIDQETICHMIFCMACDGMLELKRPLEAIQNDLARIAKEHRKHTGEPNSLLEMYEMSNHISDKKESEPPEWFQNLNKGTMH